MEAIEKESGLERVDTRDTRKMDKEQEPRPEYYALCGSFFHSAKIPTCGRPFQIYPTDWHQQALPSMTNYQRLVNRCLMASKLNGPFLLVFLQCMQVKRLTHILHIGYSLLIIKKAKTTMMFVWCR